MSTAADPSPTEPRPLVRIRGLKVHYPIRSGLLLGRQVGAVQAVEIVGQDREIALRLDHFREAFDGRGVEKLSEGYLHMEGGPHLGKEQGGR